MTITSTAFGNNQPIPRKYTCQGANLNPPLSFLDVPKDAQSLVLIMDDLDAPGSTFTHWLLYNMPPTTRQILEGQVPIDAMAGLNDTGSTGYIGPCPPTGEHHYHFTLYAVDKLLGLGTGVNKTEVLTAMEGHILAQALLTGLYQKT